MTPDSSRAEGCTCAPAARPLAANSEEGRNAAGNSARATVMKARYGSSVVSTASAAGAVASNCGASRQTPARVVASSPRYFRFSKKLRSPGPAASRGAMLRMRRSSGVSARGLARVRPAMSPTVSSRLAGKKSGTAPPYPPARARESGEGVTTRVIRTALRRRTGTTAGDRSSVSGSGRRNRNRNGPNGESQIRLAPTEARTAGVSANCMAQLPQM